MMRFVFLILGIAFGFILIQSGVSNYNVIRDMFLFKSIHLYGVLAIAVSISFVGVFILKKTKAKALLTKEEITYENDTPSKNHIIGGILAGLGWALTGACPGPALAQIGFGTLSGLFTLAGIFIGVYTYGSLQSRKG